jgi:surface protein
MGAAALLCVASLLEAVACSYVMTDSNIYAARDAWLSDSAAAEAYYGHISTWETSGVTDMSYLFCALSGWYYASYGCNTAAASFNEDISAWDTSGVTTMRSMFYYASAFDQDLGWCVGDEVDLDDAFGNSGCESTSCGVVQFVDQSDCSVPRTGNVMVSWKIRWAVTAWLANATAAEATYGHISTWETGGVTDMAYLFCGCSWCSECNAAAASFNDDIGAWETSSVTTMQYTFLYASAFNRDIGGWAVHSIKDMEGMFQNAQAFNQDISDWAVHSVTSMRSMFYYASAFDHAPYR